MKKRIISLCLVISMFFALIPAAGAANIEDMTDVSGHWAEEYIAWVLENGLFNGISDTEFAPDGSMTRGMFVTVLGRFAGIDPEEYKNDYLPNLYSDIDGTEYYAPYVNWATRYGITTGMGDGKFGPFTSINREQMATFMVRFAKIYGYEFLPITEDIPEAFEDMDKVNEYARESVEQMRLSGVMNGQATSTGYSFDPWSNATRAQCAAVLCRMNQSLIPDEDAWIQEPTEIFLYDESLRMCPDDVYEMYVYFDPYYTTNRTITWISSDPSVVSVDRSGVLTAHSIGTAQITAYTCNGLSASCDVTVEEYVGYAGESYYSKMMHVFGEIVDNPRKPYGEDAPKEVYLANMVTVSVQVWDFKNPKDFTSEKVTKTRTFKIHKNLARTVQLIFEEIYACEAQYPINSIVDYFYTGSGSSEHNPGLAIDINPEQNPYIPAGSEDEETAKKFDPENNPYSMPIDGEIQQIFEKYGFYRGFWNSGTDYMHYSFFGT